MVRFKNRYALFEVRAAPGEEAEVRAALRAAQVAKALRDVIQTNFGDHGMACVQPSLNVKYLSPTTGLGILRVARDHYRIVWLALTLLTELAGHACLVRVLHIGGTIRSCQRAALKYSMQHFEELQRAATAAGRDASGLAASRDAVQQEIAALAS